MLRVAAAVFVFLALVLAGCDSGDTRGHVAPPAAVPTGTPVRGSSVIRLDTFGPVYEAFVDGRVPGGLINEVTIALASAGIDGFYIGEEFGQDLYVDLAIVAAANRRDFINAGGHSYEWWFTSTEQVDDYPLQITADEAELKLGVRFVDGAWGLYVDDGTGWKPIEGSFTFGVHEVSARVRIDEAWRATDTSRQTYMRALIRHEEATPDGFQVGDIYPRDGMWNVVTN